MTAQEYAATLYGEVSDNAISALLAERGWHVSPETIRRWRRRAGAPAYVRPEQWYSPEQLEQGTHAYEQSDRHMGIAAQRLGIGREAMRLRLRAAGVLP